MKFNQKSLCKYLDEIQRNKRSNEIEEVSNNTMYKSQLFKVKDKQDGSSFKTQVKMEKEMKKVKDENVEHEHHIKKLTKELNE